MTSGGLCVMTPGTTLMQQWSASSWDMLILQVRTLSDLCGGVPYFVNQTPKLLTFISLKSLQHQQPLDKVHTSDTVMTVRCGQ